MKKIINKTNLNILNFGTIPIILLICLCCLIFSFSTTRSYIIYRGEKYYKCDTEYRTDTLESPGSVIIQQTKTVLYDHFACPDYN